MASLEYSIASVASSSARFIMEVGMSYCSISYGCKVDAVSHYRSWSAHIGCSGRACSQGVTNELRAYFKPRLLSALANDA